MVTMLLELLQAGPGVIAKATPIDWAVIAAILTVISGVVIRVIIPGWLHIKNLQSGDGNPTVVRVNNGGGNGDGEWRGKTSEQLNQQDKLLSGLVTATTAIEKILEEIARRTVGSEEAIRTVAEIKPKVDTILAITKKRARRRP